MTQELTNEVNLQEPVKETTVEAPKETGFSNREALQKSIEINREGKDPAEVVPTRKEVTQAVQEEVDAPSEFSAAGKKAWKSKDVTGIQKEFRRIHDSRTAEITRAQQAERVAKDEGKTWRELGEMAKPYIESRGAQGITPQTAMMEALALINEFKKGDPAQVKAELKRIGIDLDKTITSTATASAALPKEVEEKINSLQEVANEYKKDKEAQRYHQAAQTFDAIFNSLTSQKTRTGESVFPDLLDNSETGIAFARDLGSLTSDLGFQNLVRRRFPNADQTVITREAYIQLGGKVSGEPVKVSTQSNQQHLQRSRRAAAATPGRTAPRINESNLNGKLSKRAALEKAWEIHKEH